MGIDLIITYVRGEPIIGIFKPKTDPPSWRILQTPDRLLSIRKNKSTGSLRPKDQHATAMGRVSGSGQRHPYHRHWNMQAAETSPRQRNLSMNSSWNPIRNTVSYLKKQHLSTFQNPNPGTMWSISNQTSSWKTVRSTCSPPLNRRNLTSFSMTIYF